VATESGNLARMKKAAGHGTLRLRKVLRIFDR
jgi:hypothetical protein